MEHLNSILWFNFYLLQSGKTIITDFVHDCTRNYTDE